MTAAARPAGGERYDVRTVVGGGVKLGLVTTVGVVLFALLSRPMSLGTFETIVQSMFVLAGGAVFSFLPAWWVRPRNVDSIAWASLVGLLGALTFTVIDTALLRPLSLYHWTWDQIGGGSGFWYIPVWWMGSAVLAWLGSWITAITTAFGTAPNIPVLAGRTVGLAVLVFVILVVAGIGPFHTAIMALAYTLGLIIHVPLAAALRGR